MGHAKNSAADSGDELAHYMVRSYKVGDELVGRWSRCLEIPKWLLCLVRH